MICFLFFFKLIILRTHWANYCHRSTRTWVDMGATTSEHFVWVFEILDQGWSRVRYKPYRGHLVIRSTYVINTLRQIQNGRYSADDIVILFFKWKPLFLTKIFIEISSLRLESTHVGPGSYDDSDPNRWQAITWSKAQFPDASMRRPASMG